MAIKEVKVEAATELQKENQRFWKQFNDYTSKDERFGAEFKNHPYADVRPYQDYSVGTGLYHLNSHVDFRKKECKIGVYFNNTDAWRQYYDNRRIIEQNLNSNLEWKEHTTKASAYIVIPLNDDQIKDWKYIDKLIVDNLYDLKKEFGKYVEDYNRTYWLISCNDHIFNIDDCLNENTTVDWHASFFPKIGDIVFIYRTRPLQKICYMLKTIKTNIPYEESADDFKYWMEEHSFDEMAKPGELYHRLELIETIDNPGLHLNMLQRQGMKGVPQGPRKLSGPLLDYVLSFFSGTNNDYDEIDEPDNYFEGAVKQVCVNSYERNPYAREKCISAHGCKCSVCGIDFEEVYGEIGRGFIHVHHKVPISSIGSEYKLDPINDLVPVCPNCHSMLHRKHGEVMTIEELKQLMITTHE